MTIIEELKTISSELTDLHHIMALLQWDQEVMMPSRGAGERASQMATLSAEIHRKEVSPVLGELLDKVEDKLTDYSKVDRGLVRVMRRRYDQSTKLPEDFVTSMTRLTSEALHVWVEARKEADFSRFQPFLEKIVKMSREQVEFLGYSHEPYDGLLDLYEEGLTASYVQEMFAGLIGPLTDLLKTAMANPRQELVLEKDFEQDQQVRFAEMVLEKIGYDFSRGRQDVSTHPFSTTLGHHDRRVTNRYSPRSIEFIFSAMHEGGHGMYEQGIAQSLQHSCLDSGISLGIHESQSRLWENIIGRGRPFWCHFYPELQNLFPEHLTGLTVENFVRAINVVNPGCIRVEADEVTYNLHVMIRFELERALIGGAITVAELPDAWNSMYSKYLNVEVDSDANGVLQDIHWAHGSFGYFPTYTIGNLAAAQIWNTYTTQVPDYEKIIETGRLDEIREWLVGNIYQHGSVYTPRELITKVTGEPLSYEYFVAYLRERQQGNL